MVFFCIPGGSWTLDPPQKISKKRYKIRCSTWEIQLGLHWFFFGGNFPQKSGDWNCWKKRQFPVSYEVSKDPSSSHQNSPEISPSSFFHAPKSRFWDFYRIYINMFSEVEVFEGLPHSNDLNQVHVTNGGGLVWTYNFFGTFSPRNGGKMIPILTFIFFQWVVPALTIDYRCFGAICDFPAVHSSH